MEKPANNIHPVHPMIKRRWSPRAYNSRPVEEQKLKSLFEAARWAASGSNDQPWRFILGYKGDKSWNDIFDSLVEFNQLWARDAPVLVLVSADSIRQKTGGPNPSFEYDTGQAVATLSLQATDLGLFVHQMGGFNKEKVSASFSLPESIKPIVVVAIGYYGNADNLHPNLQVLEKGERMRNDFSTFVFEKKHGSPSSLFNH